MAVGSQKTRAYPPVLVAKMPKAKSKRWAGQDLSERRSVALIEPSFGFESCFEPVAARQESATARGANWSTSRKW